MTTDHRPFSSIKIAGVRADRVDLNGLLGFLRRPTASRRASCVLYVNPHVVNLARHSAELRAALDAADVVYSDGFGMRLGAWILGEQLPQRMTAADFLDEVCRQCADDNRSLYLLGGEAGVARCAAKTLSARHPRLRIAGCHHGRFSAEEEDGVVAEIARAAPDLLLVGMGSPKQELWLKQNLDRLNVRVGWAVGALFDFISGNSPRAPRWMSRHGLEWLYRLRTEPRRLWRRYTIGNLRFIAAVFSARLSGKG